MRSKSTLSLRSDEAHMLALSLDEYAALMLDEGRYSVDPDTGTVTGRRFGRPLKGGVDGAGYPTVHLAYSRNVQRPIRVHRLIAVSVWGVEAVSGMHVAHLDRNKAHSVRANLQLMTPTDHNHYDDLAARMRAAKSAKPVTVRVVAPCARCGEGETLVLPGIPRPARMSGRAFGVAGRLCRDCFNMLRKTTRPHKGRPVECPAKRKAAWLPCAVCSDPDGRVVAGCHTPSRRDGAIFGIEGELCYRCYSRLSARKRAAEGYIRPSRRKQPLA